MKKPVFSQSPILIENELGIPEEIVGPVGKVVKLEYLLAIDPGPGAVCVQSELFEKVPIVTFSISSSMVLVAEDGQ